MTYDPDSPLDLYVEAVCRGKATDLAVLDVKELTSIADTLIICSGRSHRQVVAIAESIQNDLKKYGVKPLGVEGEKEGHWVLLDYGYVIIHVFHEPVRSFYDLEGLWVDARRLHFE